MRTFLTAVLILALAGYATDCAAMSSSQQAMECCKSTSCPSHSHQHSEDCCKETPQTHTSFVQPSSAHGGAPTLVVIAVATSFNAAPDLGSSAQILVAAQSHAPPIEQIAAPLPLRI